MPYPGRGRHAGAHDPRGRPRPAWWSCSTWRVPSAEFLRAPTVHRAGIPIICIADRRKPEASSEALRLGIADLVARPVREEEVTAAIANAREFSGRRATKPEPAPGIDSPPAAFSARPRRSAKSSPWCGGSRPAGATCSSWGSGAPAVNRSRGRCTRRARTATKPFVKIECDSAGAGLAGAIGEGRSPERPSISKRSARCRQCAASAGGGHQAPGGVVCGSAPHRQHGAAGRRLGRARRPACRSRRSAGGGPGPAAAASPANRRHSAARDALSEGGLPAERDSPEDVLAIGTDPAGGAAVAGQHGRAPCLDGAPRGHRHSRRAAPGGRAGQCQARRGGGAGGTFGHTPRGQGAIERDYVVAVLQHHRGRMGDAAHALGIERTNLYRKIKQLNVRWTTQ